MKTITKQELIAFDACHEGLRRFSAQTKDTDDAVEIISLIGGQNTVGDLLWLAGKILPKEKIVKFACDCALINIETINPYTDRYDEIVSFLKDPIPDAARAARAAYAARAARAAAYAADAARAAAYAADAARAAAYAADAADAAYAAAYAADAAYAASAAADAADAAYAAAATAKIEEFLRELFA